MRIQYRRLSYHPFALTINSDVTLISVATRSRSLKPYNQFLKTSRFVLGNDRAGEEKDRGRRANDVGHVLGRDEDLA